MILVVDHDPETLEQAQKILNRDRQVFLASTAEQALELVRRLGFSVVLVDLDLPGDGYALIQKLHDHNPDLLGPSRDRATQMLGRRRQRQHPAVIHESESPPRGHREAARLSGLGR